MIAHLAMLAAALAVILVACEVREARDLSAG